MAYRTNLGPLPTEYPGPRTTVDRLVGILERRVAGGLNQEQQETILADIAKYLHPGAMKNPVALKMQDNGYEAMVRLAASLGATLKWKIRFY